MDLFTNYNKNVHPLNNGVLTNIKLGVSVIYLDIDELKGEMILHSWLRLSWMEQNRTWNPLEYDNITQIHLKPNNIWKPDVQLFNTAGDGNNYIGDTQVLLWNDGTFLWVPPAVYKEYCELNLRLWPYDTQTCSMKIGCWSLTYINPNSSEDLEHGDLTESTEWEISDNKHTFYQNDYYNYMEYTFTLKRRSSMYAAVIFTPASCIVLLALSTFWLPPQMGEKILLNGIVIVVIVTFLMYFAQLLPILAENTPLIVLFYSSSLVLISLSTIIAVIVLYLSTAKHKRRIPDFLKNLLSGPMGSVLCLTHLSVESEPQNGTKELSEHICDNPDNDLTDPLCTHHTATPSNRSIQFDWVLLATAVDRICFLCYCLIFLILAIVYSV